MKFDIIIFGASGYTGQFVVEYLARALAQDGAKLTWAISGRSESKLKTVLEAASKTTGLDLHSIPVVVCDVKEASSLAQMAAQARLVLNCVGPYRFYGEQVVKACVEAATHHLDISGEPQFMEKMQLHYHEPAQAQGVYVISSCGFDSIPSDLGQMFLTSKMEGDVNDIETYLSVTTPPNVSGPVINFGTWQSAIYGLAMAHELKPLRQSLYPERLPALQPKLKARPALHFNDVVQGWCLPFLGSDRSVMIRTQRARFHRDKKRPAQVGCYVRMSSLFYAVCAIFVGAIFSVLAKSSWGRYLLETYPRFWSAGAVSKEGPSQAMTEETNFEMKLVGRGWRESQSDPTANPSGTPTRQVTVTVKGKNVGYGSTCQCLVQSALVLLSEADRMPGQGGVYPPGYAFARTSLVDRLTQNHVTFEAEVEDF
ncbi:hypothetical protein TCAL_05842 [Tigriopus californicus]|uniref:Saccharopine dehydrogenase NADP binding domain-containing protein n=1 Tax=Tigriopus californicus TaxID=6832 RepID=A0A553P7S7_TIGCA|nr:saccharopine dehydrogenase-like oxidoreductase [Tigriopus californicus]TRY73723.1 hypothetical protein TCAL_05842 [Tigriopus californicus]|eukprot:TCALIF_05842-PA protein Name:"Similar to SCCPDH Saccharopine dehydrogenase-like oxidoreductase (Homo sapiens)" AED:0.02 eAED:0.02 QI:0/-1/0/1/-1/1/1/0/425